MEIIDRKPDANSIIENLGRKPGAVTIIGTPRHEARIAEIKRFINRPRIDHPIAGPEDIRG